jgi:hypothetical protein
MKKTTRLFPDTGYHAYFVPFAIDVTETNEDWEAFQSEFQVPDFSDQDRDQIRRLVKARSRPWYTAKGDRAWLRGQFGAAFVDIAERRRVEAFGFWVGVDTTTGVRTRGYTYRTEDVPEESSEIVKLEGDPLSTPYIARDPLDLMEQRTLELDLAECFEKLSELVESFDRPPEQLTLSIRWIEQIANEARPVSLIVDFGNSRTMVIGLETGGGERTTSLKNRVRVIGFPGVREDAAAPIRDDRSVDELIPESWFLLTRPPFEEPQFFTNDALTSEVEYETNTTGFFRKKTTRRPTAIVRRVPHQFVELSPALIGDTAKRKITESDVSGEGRVYLSSPKRYAWDLDPLSHEPGTPNWTMLVDDADESVPLRCEMLRFMPKNPAARDYSAPPDETLPPTEYQGPQRKSSPIKETDAPDFCRADSLVWIALRILEHSYQTIHSESWREKNQAQIPRFIDHIMVTYPPGWTLQERQSYERAWTYARNIFYWSRYYGAENAPAPPQVSIELDEAIATQLTIVFSEISHLGGNGDEWFELFGRERNGKQSVRVMTIDIGGGTTDTSVVEYEAAEGRARGGFTLRPAIIFTDSLSDAGDALMKTLIEELLLPTIGAGLRDEQKSEFEAFWGEKPWPAEEFQRSLVVRLVFIPMVLAWIEQLGDRDLYGRPPAPVSPNKAKCASEQVDQFNKWMRERDLPELLPFDQPLEADFDLLDHKISQWARRLADIHARYAALFQCDMLVVGGKPSEMPHMKRIIEERIPLPRDRIIFTKGYFAGDWLPLNKRRNTIQDAKMVTAIGAALYRGMQKEIFEGAKIEPRSANTETLQNYWGRMSASGKAMLPSDIFMDPEQDSVNVELNLFQPIGRMRLPHSMADPVYRLRWAPGSDLSGQATVTVKLQRVMHVDANRDTAGSEGLKLVEVVSGDIDGRPVELEDLELQLQTLVDGTYWLDRPVFELHWPEERV